VSSRALAHLSYREFLRSDRWKEIRAEAIERAGHRCALCAYEGDRLEVHHRSYARAGGDELPEDLVCLCHDCHGAYELGQKYWSGA
jgi:5-methylcytosine-specific restriction endonuclease McrA